MTTPDRIVTVTTLRERPATVDRFVARNLTTGVDHMLVFLDEDLPEVSARLASNPHVTVVHAWGEDYWGGGRPSRIEQRQAANATLANAVLACVPSVRWLFHIDCDEALDFDRGALLGSDLPLVRFRTWETVATPHATDEEAVRFKRRPSEIQLLALSALGVIDEPELARYFRGHAAGKIGVRPDLGVRLTIHAALDSAGERIVMPNPKEFHLLHYESWCLDDFAERWRDYSPEQAAGSVRGGWRRQIGLAAYAILSHPVLDDGAKRKYLGRLFDRQVADDVRSLELLDLLADPPERRRTPVPLSDEDRTLTETLLDLLRGAPKAPFVAATTSDALAAALDEAVARTTDPVVTESVRRTTGAFRGSHAGVAERQQP